MMMDQAEDSALALELDSTVMKTTNVPLQNQSLYMSISGFGKGTILGIIRNLDCTTISRMLIYEILQFRLEYTRLFVEGNTALVEVVNNPVNREILEEFAQLSLQDEGSFELLNGESLTCLILETLA